MTENTKPIFRYLSARRFVVDQVERRKRGDRSFSIRKWAKEMGMPTHTLLVMALQGKRTFTLKQAPLLSKGLGLTTPEQLYFQCLIQYENAKTDEERELIRMWMSELNPGGNAVIKKVDEFLVISHWVHMAILSLADTREGVVSAEQVHKRLGDRITLQEVDSALERLKAMGLLHEKNGKWIASQFQVTTTDGKSNKGSREYNKQVNLLAHDAIDRLPLDRRESQAFAIAIPEDKIAMAKEMIRKFRIQFCNAMTAGESENVFQMNIQLFQLTESPSNMVSKEDKGTGTDARDRAGSAIFQTQGEA